MSQDSKDDKASSVADDDSSPYEEMLAAVVNAKEGDRSLSDIFKVLPPKDVRILNLRNRGIRVGEGWEGGGEDALVVLMVDSRHIEKKG